MTLGPRPSKATLFQFSRDTSSPEDCYYLSSIYAILQLDSFCTMDQNPIWSDLYGPIPIKPWFVHILLEGLIAPPSPPLPLNPSSVQLLQTLLLLLICHLLYVLSCSVCATPFVSFRNSFCQDCVHAFLCFSRVICFLFVCFFFCVSDLE